MNEKYKVKLEILTPTFIGTGTENDLVEGVDYVVSDGKFYKINLQKILNAGVDSRILSSYIEKRDSKAIIHLLAGRLDEVSDYAMKMPIGNNGQIKPIVKNEFTGKPIVPGSSIKGAIRSVIFSSLVDKVNNIVDEKRLFGNPSQGEDFMRFMKISDFEFDKRGGLTNSVIFNLYKDSGGWQGGWKHGMNSTDGSFSQTRFNTVYETLMPGQSACGRVMLSPDAFDRIKVNINYKKSDKESFLSIGKLFSAINDHTYSHLKKEFDFFKKYQNNQTEEILNSLDQVVNAFPAEDDNTSCVIRMSAGSGFHSITGDWRFDTYEVNGVNNFRRISRGLFNGKESAKSRKISIVGDRLYPMGFVKMSL